MSLFAVLLVLVLLALGGWLWWTVQQLHQRIAALHLRLGALPLPPPSIEGKACITIEILNPFELAAKETRLAGPAAKLAPKMIERIVYERAAAQIAEQMAEQGVVAVVTTHVP